MAREDDGPQHAATMEWANDGRGAAIVARLPHEASRDMTLTDWLGQAIDGPFALRFVLQPAIAVALAIRDGRRDARTGAAPFFYRLLFGRGGRGDLLHSAWKTLAFPLLLAFVLDSVVQVIVEDRYQLRTSLAVGVLLVGLPYSLVRGLACRAFVRIGRRRHA